MMRKGSGFKLGIGALCLLFLAACAPAAAPTSPPAKAEATAAPAPKPAAAPATQPAAAPVAKATAAPAAKPTAAPAAKPAPKVTVRLAQTGQILSFAPTYIARDRFFPEENIDIQFELVTGVTGLQALMGDSVDVTAGASNESINAVERGVDLLVFSGNVAQTLDMVANKDWMRKQGVTPQSPLDQKFKALKGSVIGITTPGAISDTAARWMLKRVGFNPEKDATLQTISAAGARMGALKQGLIDVYLSSPPEGPQVELDGYGAVFIGPQEIQEWKNYVHEVVYTKRQYAQKNPDVMVRMARALAKANNFLLDKPEESKQILKKYFDKVDPNVVSASTDSIRQKVLRDGRMSPEAWQNTASFLLEAGAIKTPPDLKEGAFWTNEYIRKGLEAPGGAGGS